MAYLSCFLSLSRLAEINFQANYLYEVQFTLCYHGYAGFNGYEEAGVIKE